MRLIYLAVLFLTGIPAGEAQTPKKTPASATQPKFKAIWEPANYPKDINLLDVRFVSGEEGWAVGDKNTILHGCRELTSGVSGTPPGADLRAGRSFETYGPG